MSDMISGKTFDLKDQMSIERSKIRFQSVQDPQWLSSCAVVVVERYQYAYLY